MRLEKTARDLVEYWFPGLTDYVARGTHYLNPYHNTTHMMLVAYHAVAAAQHEGDASDETINDLILAGMFHDYNHSGGALTDDKNIDLACTALRRYAAPVSVSNVDSCRDEATVNRIVDAIRCTQFKDGKFTYAPQSNIQRYLRDADLCMIYCDDGLTLTRELAYEMPSELFTYAEAATGKIISVSRNKSNEHDAFWAAWCAKTSWFLRQATMYSEYGKVMRDRHLERRLTKLCLQVIDDYRLEESKFWSRYELALRWERYFALNISAKTEAQSNA